jgi:HNH endonuclease
MDPATRHFVRMRAKGRCEYCGLPEHLVPLITFHLEHVVPRQHGGSDDQTNLAMACPWCNRAKGPNLSGIDPETNALVPLFNPRQQVWSEHFAYHETSIIGLSPVGRATVRVLAMNRAEPLEIRAWLMTEGAFFQIRPEMGYE